MRSATTRTRCSSTPRAEILVKPPGSIKRTRAGAHLDGVGGESFDNDFDGAGVAQLQERFPGEDDAFAVAQDFDDASGDGGADGNRFAREGAASMTESGARGGDFGAGGGDIGFEGGHAAFGSGDGSLSAADFGDGAVETGRGEVAGGIEFFFASALSDPIIEVGAGEADLFALGGDAGLGSGESGFGSGDAGFSLLAGAGIEDGGTGRSASFS